MNLITPIILGLFLFLLPLFFLPFTVDFFDFNKITLLLICTIILFITWLIRIVIEKRFILKVTLFDIPLVLLSSVYILSTILFAPNKMGALLAPLGVVTLITSILLYFLLNQNDEETHNNDIAILSMLAAGIVLSFIVLIYSTKIPSFIPISWLKSPAFNPQGTPFFAFLFLLLPLSFGLIKMIKNFSIGLFVGVAIISLAEIVLGVSFIKYGLNILPYPIGITILEKTWTTLPFTLLGIGPANFLSAFTLNRPEILNTSAYWNVLFTQSSSYLLTLATETGLIAAISFILLPLLSIITFIRADESQKFLYIPLFVIFIVHIFSITNSTLFIYMLVLLSLTSPKKTILNINLKRLKHWTLLLAVPPLIGIVILTILGGRVYVAEVYFKKSLNALSQNKGQEVYNLQREAIRKNPYMDKYHMAFSQTNLSIANSFAGKKDPTKEDQQNISKLVQQAVNEGRIAVSLNQTSVTNWNNLASIYNALIKFAGGAEEWAITAFKQVIILNPTDPQSRLSLGGVYYSEGRYDEAIQTFDQAVKLKPNWANAHYNLSATFREKKDYPKAIEEMEKVLKLVSKDSEEYQKAKEELDTLKKLQEKS